MDGPREDSRLTADSGAGPPRSDSAGPLGGWEDVENLLQEV